MFKALRITTPEADARRLYYLAEAAKRLSEDEEMLDAVRQLGQRYSSSQWRLKALLSAGNRFIPTHANKGARQECAPSPRTMWAATRLHSAAKVSNVWEALAFLEPGAPHLVWCASNLYTWVAHFSRAWREVGWRRQPDLSACRWCGLPPYTEGRTKLLSRTGSWA